MDNNNDNIYRAPGEDYIVTSYAADDNLSKSSTKGVLAKIIVSVVLTALGCLLIPVKNLFPSLPVNYLIFLFVGFLLCDIALYLAIRAYLQLISRDAKEDDSYDTNLANMKKIALIWLICSVVITFAVTFLFAYLVGKNGMDSLFGKK